MPILGYFHRKLATVLATIFEEAKIARIKVEELMEKKVTQLREAEKEKHEELYKIQNELRRYEIALESLRKDFPVRKRRGKQVFIKPVYLAVEEAARKWTFRHRDCAMIYSQLMIYFGDRMGKRA